jgi:hypothetical protein
MRPEWNPIQGLGGPFSREIRRDRLVTRFDNAVPPANAPAVSVIRLTLHIAATSVGANGLSAKCCSAFATPHLDHIIGGALT